MRYNDMRGNCYRQNYRQDEPHRQIGFQLNTAEPDALPDEDQVVAGVGVREAGWQANKEPRLEFAGDKASSVTGAIFSLSILLRLLLEVAVAGAAYYLFGVYGLLGYGILTFIRFFWYIF